MLENVYVFCQSSIKIDREKKIYFDPYNMDKDFHDADIIFITHDHYDHYDINSIKKIVKEDTYIVIPHTLKEEVSKYFDSKYIFEVDPGCEYLVNGLSFRTVRAYNIHKKFHPKENNWVGYIIEINNIKYYIAGDTDITNEAKNVKCDIAFLPIGGIYTMDYKEAAILTNTIKPKIVVPIHYGSIVGTITDAINFKNSIDEDIKCELLDKK
jgi:L-ascorbate metabolism protein UlaG (beta-lactamase superfamily)